MKIDLEELERRLRDDDDEYQTSTRQSLSLIARIRELEGALGEGCAMVRSCIAMGDWGGIGMQFERLSKLLEKGAVLP